MALAARAAGIRRLFVPADSAPEATLAQGLTVYPVETVGQLADHLRPGPIDPAPVWQGGEEDLPLPDFAEVRGQGPVKRVLEIAPPPGGTTCSWWAPGLGEEYAGPGWLPLHPAPMTRREALETTQIHSVLGLTTKERPC